MKKYPAKTLGPLLMGISAFSLFSPAALAASMGEVLDGFYAAASGNNCPDQNKLPDAPQPSSSSQQAQNEAPAEEQPAPSSTEHKPSKWVTVMNRLKFQTSTGIDLNPNSPGGAGIKDGYFGVTYGEYQISQMLARSGIPITDKPIVTFDVNVAFAPTVPGLAQLAGKSAKDDIKSKEAGAAWEKKDLDSVDERVKALNGVQKITVSAAVITKDGKMYTCEVGKAPVNFIPANSPDGSMTEIENSKGGSDDALRVGSSFSTSVGKCTFAKSLGTDSKIQFGFQAYRNTLPYKDTNTLIANEIFENETAFKANNHGSPAFRADMVYNKKLGKNIDLNVNATGGETLGKAIGSVSGTLRTGINSFSAATGQNYFTGMTGEKPNDPNSAKYVQANKGTFVSDSVKVHGNISAFASAAWNKGVPNSGQAKTENGIVNFNTQDFGVVLDKVVRFGNPKGRYANPEEAQDRFTASVAYQRTTSPDGSMPEGHGIVGSIRISTAGAAKSTWKAAKKAFKARDPDDEDIEGTVDVNQVVTLPKGATPETPPPAEKPAEPLAANPKN